MASLHPRHLEPGVGSTLRTEAEPPGSTRLQAAIGLCRRPIDPAVEVKGSISLLRLLCGLRRSFPRFRSRGGCSSYASRNSSCFIERDADAHGEECQRSSSPSPRTAFEAHRSVVGDRGRVRRRWYCKGYASGSDDRCCFEADRDHGPPYQLHSEEGKEQARSGLGRSCEFICRVFFNARSQEICHSTSSTSKQSSREPRRYIWAHRKVDGRRHVQPNTTSRDFSSFFHGKELDRAPVSHWCLEVDCPRVVGRGRHPGQFEALSQKGLQLKEPELAASSRSACTLCRSFHKAHTRRSTVQSNQCLLNLLHN